MIRLAADECLDDRIVRGELRRNPGIDVLRVRDAGLSGTLDPGVLAWAASEGRVLLSHDRNTMTAHALRRIAAGLPMPGLFVVARRHPLPDLIEDVLLIAEASSEGEYEGLIDYVPLR